MRVRLQKIKGSDHFTFKGVRCGGCLFLLSMLMACFSGKSKGDRQYAYQMIDSIRTVVKNGDIILRNGTDAISDAARSFNRKDKTYSHCGIIQIENDTVFVYHALGGDYNPSQCLMRQALDSFCNPAEMDRVAVYRYPMKWEQTQRLSTITKDHYKNKLPFDLYFNFYTDESMYCSEFVFKSLNKAFDSSLIHLLHTDQRPLYVSIDDLYLNNSAQLIKEVSF